MRAKRYIVALAAVRAKRYMVALATVVCLAVGVAACGSGVPGDAVANMAGNPITLQAFNHWIYVAAKSQAAQSPGQPVIVPNDPPNFSRCVAQVRAQIPSLASTPTKTLQADCRNLFTALSTQVMDFLVKSYWYQAQAAREHVTVSDAQVLNAFNAAKNQQFASASQYEQFLSATGQTTQDVLYRFRVNQLYTKLVAKQGSTVSQAQIRDYYNAHRSQFATPEERDLHIVLTNTAGQANAAKAALQGGQSWNVVAKQYSTDTATKNNGGLLVNVAKGQEDAALDSAAFSAPQGQLVGPVKGQFGYYVLEVTRIRPATQQSLAQATPTIRRQLISQQQTTAQTAVDSAAKRQWQPKTSCRSDYAMTDCSNYKASSSSSSSSSSPGSGASSSSSGG